MFADPLNVILDAETDVDFTKKYSLVSMGQGSSERRVVEQSLTNNLLGQPNTMKISHQTVGKGDKARTRHLLRFDTREIIAAQPIPGSEEVASREGNVVASAYVVFDIPVGWEMSPQTGYLVSHLIGCLRGSNGNLRLPYGTIPEPPASGPDPAYFLRGWLNGMV